MIYWRCGYIEEQEQGGTRTEVGVEHKWGLYDEWVGRVLKRQLLPTSVSLDNGASLYHLSISIC